MRKGDAAAGTGAGSGSDTGSGSGSDTGSETDTGTETETETETETGSGSETEVDSGKPARKPLKERLEDLIAEYGAVAFVIFLSIFLLTYAGFFIAIKAGIDVDTSSAGRNAGTLFAAWFATKLTMPLRVLATLVLTPIVGSFVHRKRHPEE